MMYRHLHTRYPSDANVRINCYCYYLSSHSVNAIFTGANTIYEVSAKHPIIDACLSLSQSTLIFDSQQSSLSILIMFTNVSLFQTEIDTHLNILHIVLNANYAASTSTSAALTQMRTLYSRTATQGWHYISPNGIKPDLHHAVLGKNLGGGIAYVSVICNSNYGFGLSASLSGGYISMGNAVVWDMMVVSISAE